MTQHVPRKLFKLKNVVVQIKSLQCQISQEHKQKRPFENQTDRPNTMKSSKFETHTPIIPNFVNCNTQISWNLTLHCSPITKIQNCNWTIEKFHSTGMTLKKQNLTTTYEFNISTYSIITYFLVLTILRIIASSS